MHLPFKRLFILGAGFSHPAGLPLAEELMQSVREDVEFYFQGYGWDGALEKEIKEWRSLYPGQPIDLERVLAYSHRKHYLRLMGSEEYFEDGSRSIVAVRKMIQHTLTLATPHVTPTLYRDFVTRLTTNDVILTFNYDTLLEQSLDEIAKPYTLTPEWWLRERSSGLEPLYVDVLKLHGSIDWYDRHYHEDAMRYHAESGADVPDRDPLFGPSPTVPTEPLAHGPTGDFGRHILPRVFRVPNHALHFPIEGGVGSHIVPFILPPAHDKLLGFDPIVDLWWSLHHHLDAYSSIVIIGYSFPSHDSYAYEALGHLLVNYQRGGSTTGWEQRRVPIQLITVAESPKDALKTVPFLAPEETRVWRHGFSLESLNWIDWGDGAN